MVSVGWAMPQEQAQSLESFMASVCVLLVPCTHSLRVQHGGDSIVEMSPVTWPFRLTHNAQNSHTNLSHLLVPSLTTLTLNMGKYNPTLCPCVRNTSLNTRKKLTIVFSRRGPPLRPFGITQICKAFSAGKIGEGLARGLNFRRGEYAGIRCRVMSISLPPGQRTHR